MLYLIGLGLSDETDMSLKALKALEGCDKVYLENYTGVFKRLPELEELIGKSIQVLGRSEVEELKEFLNLAKSKKVALLVQGDPLSATTHFSIILECRKRDIPFKIISSSSIFTAVARTGLSLYKFGKTASIPLPVDGFKPSSFYSILVDNQRSSAHTLFLLDMKPDHNNYLTIPEALNILVKLDDKGLVKKVVGCARLGAKDELIKYGSPEDLIKFNWGEPPYCLIIPSTLHFIEEEALNILH